MTHAARQVLCVVAALGVAACAGGDEPVSAGGSQAVSADLPAELVASSWPVRMSDDAARARFEQGAGWGAYFNRDYDQALAAFAADNDAVGLQRVHTDLAALYGQGALLAAHATDHVYGGDDAQEADPTEVAYLVGVARALKGDCEGAAGAFAGLSPTPALASAAAAWQERVSAGCAALTATDTLPVPGAPGAVAPGTDPTGATLPHYTFQERTPEARLVEAGDPSALALRSAWHRAAAEQAGAAPDVVGQVLAPWALQGPSGSPSALTALDDGWLFAGFALSPADLAFLQGARLSGVSAVEAWSGSSLLAAALEPAVSGGTVDPQVVLEQGLAVRNALRSAMESKSGGKQGFHDPFAKMAHLAVLRAGMVLADGAGQYRDAGILRINALELSEGPVADPVFFVSVAAWDVGNRNPLRAQEIMHRLVEPYPALGAARYPLDAMHIRLSRNAAPATPVH